MNGSAVVVEAVSKTFRIGRRRQTIYGRIFRPAELAVLDVLKNISFSLDAGDRLALIGRNGCGKTTLLRLIAGIYLPDSGSILVSEAPSVILNSGAGTIPALAVEDNLLLHAAIHLPGALWGADLLETALREAALLDRRSQRTASLSSGERQRLLLTLRMRTAPNLLLLDETFSNLDKEFRRKSFEWLGRLVEQGSTWIMTSHDEEQIREFCTRAVWLERGVIAGQGSVDEVLRQYSDKA